MPEGDTIHRTATRLRRALRGKTLQRAESTLPEIAAAGLTGRHVEDVKARGKYLAMHFDDDRVLLSHMRMTGSWHLYRDGERWWKPQHLARISLTVGPELGDPSLVAVCFSAPVIRLTTERRGAQDLARLGPDVVADDDFDYARAVDRLRRCGGERAIGEVILDQEVLAGIGNVYKSEVLFAESVSPFAPVTCLSIAELGAIAARARIMMRRNLAPGRGMRTTTSGLALGPYAVYRRSGEPCPRCGEPIARTVQGSQRRSTYYCPRCQVVGTARG